MKLAPFATLIEGACNVIVPDGVDAAITAPLRTDTDRPAISATLPPYKWPPTVTAPVAELVASSVMVPDVYECRRN